MARKISVLAISLLLPFISNSSMANEGGSILGLQTGESLTSMQQSLEEKGYKVTITNQTYKVSPDNPVSWFLLATKRGGNTIEERIHIGTDHHPETENAAVFHRVVRYKEEEGPTLAAVKESLSKIMAEKPSYTDTTNRYPNGQTWPIKYGYRWRKGKQKKPKVLGDTVDCMKLVLGQSPEKTANADDYIKLDRLQLSNELFIGHAGYYYPSCGKLAGVHIEVHKRTSLVTRISVMLMDNKKIDDASEPLQDWIAREAKSYRANLKENSAKPDL